MSFLTKILTSGIQKDKINISKKKYPPSQQYYNTILQGYRENGLDESFLQRALENSLQMDLAGEEIDEDFDIDEFEDIDYDDFQLKL